MTSVEGGKEQNGARGKRVKGRIKTSQKRKKAMPHSPFASTASMHFVTITGTKKSDSEFFESSRTCSIKSLPNIEGAKKTKPNQKKTPRQLVSFSPNIKSMTLMKGGKKSDCSG